MANADQKICDPEIGLQDMEKKQIEQETGFNNLDETAQFLPQSESDAERAPNGEVKKSLSKEVDDDFYGLTREELEMYAADPKWVKVRWILFIIFIICWAVMLIAAIIIVVVTPKCPPVPVLAWYQKDIVYHVNPKNFKDSDGDGNGDLKGLMSKIDHFTELNVKSIWLMNATTSEGSDEDFPTLAADFKKKGIRLIIDFSVGDNEDAAAVDALLRKWADAGAEGFVLSMDDEENYVEVTERLQGILDEEFNKKDDRARVIISERGLKSDSAAEMKLAIVDPLTNCTDVTPTSDCVVSQLTEAADDDLWKLLELRSVGNALCDMVLRLTAPGTAHIVYGDEIGMTGDLAVRGTMIWDDNDKQGFTSYSSFTATDKTTSSVMAQKSIGFQGTSHFKIFQTLSGFRKTEPSLLWGKVKPHEFSDGILSYTRAAEGFDPVVVAMNVDVEGGRSGSLVQNSMTVGEVLSSHGVGLKEGDVVDVNAVFLPKGGFVVIRLKETEEEE